MTEFPIHIESWRKAGLPDNVGDIIEFNHDKDEFETSINNVKVIFKGNPLYKPAIDNLINFLGYTNFFGYPYGEPKLGIDITNIIRSYLKETVCKMTNYLLNLRKTDKYDFYTPNPFEYKDLYYADFSIEFIFGFSFYSIKYTSIAGKQSLTLSSSV